MAIEDEIKELGENIALNQKTVEDTINAAEEKNQTQLSEHKEKLDKIDKDYTDMLLSVNALEKLAANSNFSLAGTGDVDNEVEMKNQQTAFVNFLRNGETNFQQEEYKLALAGAPDSGGGFLVPEFIEKGIIFPAADPVGMRNLIKARTLNTGDSVSMNSMTRPVGQWGKKGVDVSEQLFTTGRARLDMKFITAAIVADIDFLSDTDENVMAELNQLVKDEFDVMTDAAIVSGTTEDELDGFLVNADVQANVRNSGLATLLGNDTLATNGHDAIIDVAAIPKAVYTSDAAYVMNRFTAAAVRKLKDLNGQYLWSKGTEKGAYGEVNGFPVQIIEAMPDIAANTFPIAFGSFNRAYRLYDKAGGVSVQRIVEKYAASGHVGFYFRKRVLGGMRQAEALSVIKIAV